MPHLHQVVDLRACLHARLAHARTIHARIGLHFHRVLQHRRPGLHNLHPVTLRPLRKAKTIRADHGTVLQDHIIAQHTTFAHHCMGVRQKAVTDLHPGIQNRMCQKHRIVPDNAPVAHHHIRPHMRSCSEPRTRGHNGRRMDTRLILERRMKDLNRPRPCQVRILHPQRCARHHSEPRLHDHRRGAGRLRQPCILRIGHKAHLARSGLLNAGHPRNFGLRAGTVARHQLRSQPLRQIP